jgi:hypothetical protein
MNPYFGRHECDLHITVDANGTPLQCIAERNARPGSRSFGAI